MRRSALFAAILLAAATAGAQQRFANASLNFSFVTPGANWQWRALPELSGATAGGGVWVVRGPAGEQFSVSVSQRGARKLDDAWMHELLRALQTDAAKHRYRIDRFRYEPATAPVFPSYRYSYVRTGGDGAQSFVDGCVAALARVYTIQYASRDRRLSDAFDKFVNSFAVVDKFETLRGSNRLNDPQRFPGMQAIGLDSRLGRPITPNGDPGDDAP
ncbi:MAG TPA: hypothetical protein VG323_00760 [Thermoanaerobaculia bacterium]|nr:hypothetical protein [Thermoanaerobaculia bacterium]